LKRNSSTLYLASFESTGPAMPAERLPRSRESDLEHLARVVARSERATCLTSGETFPCVDATVLVGRNRLIAAESFRRVDSPDRR
jgi:hypothetical protein